MPFETRTVWWPGAIGIPHNNIVHGEADRMKGEGKTDGLFEVQTSAEGVPTVIRTWTTREAAEEWRVYVNQFTPTTCEIIEI